MKPSEHAGKAIKVRKVALASPGSHVNGSIHRIEPDAFTGELRLRFPVPLTPCREATPDLALVYGSYGGRGLFGRGFSLNLPNVARRLVNGVPLYRADDQFVLNGEQIVPVVGGPTRRTVDGTPYEVQRYRSRQESQFEFIERWIGPAGPFWRVIDDDSTAWVFGKSNAARITNPENPDQIAEWLLEYVVTSKGDWHQLQYKPENHQNVPPSVFEGGRGPLSNKYLERIQYGPLVPWAAPVPGIGSPPQTQWMFELVADYGEFDSSPSNDDIYTPKFDWAARPDPFSDFSYGFERRWHRLCAGLLLFHHFPAELGAQPVLVRKLAINYDKAPASSRLTSFTEVGYRYFPKAAPGHRYTTKSDAPVRFGYQSEPLRPRSPQLLTYADGEPVLGWGEQAQFTPADLLNDGRPGLLYSDGETVSYAAPALLNCADPDSIAWTRPRVVGAFPSARKVGEDALSLADLDAVGENDLVRNGDPLDGYYPAKEEGDWGPFTPFKQGGSNGHQSGGLYADLTGVGRLDHLLPRVVGNQITISEGRFGYAPAYTVPKPLGFPSSTRSDGYRIVTSAALSGGGTCIARITDGEVSFWPSLGRGRFGPRVQMENAPTWPPGFDPARLFVGDFFADGFAGLALVMADRIEVYRNLSGNAFDETPVVLPLPGGYLSPDQIQVSDLSGTGRADLVFTEADSRPRSWRMRVAVGTHPDLVILIDDGQGIRKQVNFASSSYFAVRSRQLGAPWLATTAFPMQTVASVVAEDRVSGVVHTTSYWYQDGWYDPTERTFSGFGFVLTVDQVDARGSRPVEPGLTRTWYHLGRYGFNQALGPPGFDGDEDALDLPTPVFDLAGSRDDARTERQAHWSLSGKEIRSEVWAAEGSPAAPLHVTQMAYQVKMLQGSNGAEPAVFHVSERESLVTDYEGNAADPRCHHHFVIELDTFGEVTSEASVDYRRRKGVQNPAPAQTEDRMGCRAYTYANLTQTDDVWLLGHRLTQDYWKIGKAPAPDIKGQYYSWSMMSRIVSDSESGGSGQPTRDLLEADRFVYEGSPITPQALLRRHEEAVVSDATAREIFDGSVYPGNLKTLFSETCGFELSQDGLWWNPGMTERYAGSQQFYLSAGLDDPFIGQSGRGLKYRYSYDPYNLLLEKTEMISAAGDVATSTITSTRCDYIVVANAQIVDENGNTHEGLWDPLGHQLLTTWYGVEYRSGKPVRTGFDPLDFDKPPDVPTSTDDLVSQPGRFVNRAATFSWYQPNALQEENAPVHTVDVTAQAYPSSGAVPPKVMVRFVDASGRSVEVRRRAPSPGPGQPYQWASSGRKRHIPVAMLPFQQFQPVYEVSWHASPEPPPTPGTLPVNRCFDALSRPVRTSVPFMGMIDAFYTGQARQAWFEVNDDADDTVKKSAFYQHYIKQGASGLPKWEKDALIKAAKLAETPETTQYDPSGNVCEQQRLLTVTASPLTTSFGHDLKGEELWSADARLGPEGIHNFDYTYFLDGSLAYFKSVDAGDRWLLRDAMGNLVLRRDTRGFLTTITYDSFHRPVEVHVSGGDGQSPLDQTVERRIYGDSLDATGAPPVSSPHDHNLVGQLYAQYDGSGCAVHSDYNLIEGRLHQTRQLRLSFDGEPNWVWNAAKTWADRMAVLATQLDHTAANEQWQYDALGKVVSLTDPGGGVRHFGYDCDGRLTQLDYSLPGRTRTYLSSATYTALGQRQQMTLANEAGQDALRIVFGYDSDTQRLRTITSTSLPGGSKLQDLAYFYDPVGNVTHVSDSAAPQPTISADLDHTFDALYRLAHAEGRAVDGLSQAQVASGSYDGFFPARGAERYGMDYHYDNGNNLDAIDYSSATSRWTSKVAVATGSNRAVPGSGPFTPASFDSDGNLLSLGELTEIGWGYRNQMRRVQTGAGEGVTVYDLDGRRVARRHTDHSSGHVETTTYFTAGYQTSEVTTGSTTVSSGWCLTISDEGTPLASRSSQTSNGNTTEFSWFQLSDALSSATIEIDDRGQLLHAESYSAFGDTVLALASGAGAASSLASKDYRFSGEIRDQRTGLYHYGMREFVCWIGRWLNPDPAMDKDGLNLYSFAHNNPVTLKDLFGLAAGKNWKKKNKGPYKGKIYKPAHKFLASRSSEFRYFRRMQRAYGGSRNIGMVKLVKGNGKSRRVMYLIARSMGMGVPMITVRGEDVMTVTGVPRKRSHSEGLLANVLAVGAVKVKNKTISLGGFTPQYAASTNEACGSDHQDCESGPARRLAPLFFFGNKYSGTAQSAGWEKTNNKHERDIRKDPNYESEDESEDEAEVYELNTPEGVDYESDQSLKFVPARPLDELLDDKNNTQRWKRQKKRPLKSLGGKI